MRGRIFARIALAAALAWAAVGIVPFAPVEGDDMAISAGAFELAEYGSKQLAYHFDVQSGSYRLIAAGRLIGLEPHTAFCLLTGVAFLIFVCSSAAYLGRVAPLSTPLCGLALLLFPESYAAGYYANTSMPAAAFAALGLMVACRVSRTGAVIAAVLLAVATWLRFDAVLMIPAAVVLAWGPARGRVLRLVASAATWIAVTTSLLLVSDASPAAVISAYASHAGGYRDLGRTLGSYSTVFTGFAVVLIAIGLWHAIGRRQWRTLVLAAAGIVPTIAAYGAALSTPKYLLYTLPFFTLLVVTGIDAVRRSRQRLWLVSALATLFAMQYVADPFAVLPGSSRVATHDGTRDRGALLRAPLRWTRQKLKARQNQRLIEREIDRIAAEQEPAVVVAGGWLSSRIVLYHQLRSKHRLASVVNTGRGEIISFEHNDRHAATVFLNPPRQHVLTPRLKESVGLGPTAVFLLVGENRSPAEIVGKAQATRVATGWPPAWIVELPR